MTSFYYAPQSVLKKLQLALSTTALFCLYKKLKNRKIPTEFDWDFSSHNWIGFGVIEIIIMDNNDDKKISRNVSRFSFILV